MRNVDGKGAGTHRLSGWQAIADYFQRNPSTVRRWAAEHGLPIHRPAGVTARKGAAVFAYPEELDDWLRRFTLAAGVSRTAVAEQSVPDPAAAEPSRPARSSVSRKWLGIGAAALGVAILAPLSWSLSEGLSRQSVDISPTASHVSTEADRELYSDAVYLVEKRTPESLLRGVALLEQLTRNDARHSHAWSQLATAYNLMVEYGQIDAATGYGLSRAAAERALALNPTLARAETVMADIDFFWFRATGPALERFERAATLDPSDAQTLHWFASALAFSGEPSRALVEIRKAKYADPSSRSIRVSEAIILLSAGQADAAGEVLESLIRHEPDYRNPYRFLAFVKLAKADYAGYLDAWNRRFELTGDEAGLNIIRAGRAGLARSGQPGMAAAMVAAIDGAEAGGGLEPYFLAHIHALSGDSQQTIDCLEQVVTRHAFYYSIDPAFYGVRQDIAFQDALRDMSMPAI